MTRERADVLDELLVLRCQAGEARAFELLARRWHPRVLGHARRLTGSPEAAPDVAQEAWMAVVRGLRRLEDPARFKGWLYRIVSHKCADWIRFEQRRRRLDGSLPEPDLAGTAEDPPQADERLVALRDGLRALPRNRRAILALFYLEAMSLKEIGEALSIPVGTVKSRLFHARAELKRRLEEES